MRALVFLLLALVGAAAAASVAAQGSLRQASPLAEEGQGSCHKWRTRKSTLKLIKETPFSGLFRDLKNSTEFEASGLAHVRGEFYAVFDNAMSIGALDDRFQFRDPANVLIGDWEPQSQFEGIAYVPENDTFLLLHEAVEHGSTYKPSVREVKIRKDRSGYDVHAVCDVDFEIEEANKGFESINYVHTPDGAFLLGLCEGNYCKGGGEGREPGNGRIVVSKLQWDSDGGCVWEPIKVLNIPPGAFFLDYAAMAYNYATQKLAVLSQEDSAIWVGDFDGDALEFKSQEGHVFWLPRNAHCEMIYCNAEGIQWIDNYRVVVASDRAKRTQPFWCDDKDQSIHMFTMPRTWDPYASAADAVARDDAEDRAHEL
ncbi:hypothetical protein C2E20_8907 [Micractinium conductrix]|uniref:Uncharacterized protein n=1 Tax=Micractinium conductrix TaxID=554055 RepID=A0A2P6V024_9CHLO|nr:hypothetical protein C2E20_8907 [Micractinium conductrix]|eukprot:PSC67394.1 hypothetical protein C2E20_8907 [Micractinium conductrix]